MSTFTCSALYQDSASPERWLMTGMFGASEKYGRRWSRLPGPGSGTLMLRLTKMFLPRVPT